MDVTSLDTNAIKLWTLYIINAILGLHAFYSEGNLNAGIVITGVIAGILLFLISCFLSMKLGKRFMVLFGAYHK